MIVKVTKTKNGDKILQKVKENNGYCPCRVDRNEDTKCMCKDFRNQIDLKIKGTCHCGLYQIELI